MEIQIYGRQYAVLEGRAGSLLAAFFYYSLYGTGEFSGDRKLSRAAE